MQPALLLRLLQHAPPQAAPLRRRDAAPGIQPQRQLALILELATRHLRAAAPHAPTDLTHAGPRALVPPPRDELLGCKPERGLPDAAPW